MRQHIKFVTAFLMVMFATRPGLADDEPELGRIPLPKGMTIQIRRSIAGTGEPAVLPRGQYTLSEWSISRTDQQGIPWTCEGLVPNDKSSFEVAQERQTELPVGEPLISTLTAVRRGSEFTFSHRLEGRLGERVSIYRDGKQAPAPKLRIRNADGSYDRFLTFEYG
jgi:hypothetical protein